MVFWKKKKEEPKATSPESREDVGATPKTSVAPTASHSEPAAREVTAPESTARVGWFRKVLTKTNELLRTDIRDLWKDGGRLVDDAFVSDLYAILVRTDIGASMATSIVDSIHNQYRARRIEMDEVLDVVRKQVSDSLKSRGGTLRMADSKPTIIMVVGVNGSGKTTSIAKLAHRLTRDGNRVLLAAGDTFRAAAVAQLRVWSERIGCDIVLGEQGSDPGTVAYRAVQKAVAESFDVCILDTAGRLQTQSNLMQQLEKMKRVIQKQVPDAPHEVLLVLDATAGQNAISQAKGFSEAAGCTGIVLSKLDGTAKGGVIVPIAEQFGLPVKFIGVGEGLEDLEVFSPDDFAAALFT